VNWGVWLSRSFYIIFYHGHDQVLHKSKFESLPPYLTLNPSRIQPTQNMQYLLHAPSHLDVFLTTDRDIARFLRHQHRWAVIKTEQGHRPENITASCIWDREDGSVAIDEVALDNGKGVLKQVVGLLERDGFEGPDLAYVGRLSRENRGSGESIGVKEDGGEEWTW